LTFQTCKLWDYLIHSYCSYLRKFNPKSHNCSKNSLELAAFFDALDSRGTWFEDVENRWNKRQSEEGCKAPIVAEKADI